MKNYEPWTIVPVGTKIVRVDSSKILIRWQTYTVVEVVESDVILKWEEKYWRFLIWCFAPYIEEEKQVKTDWIPTYVALKEMPYVSKWAILVDRTQQGNSIIVVSNTCGAYWPWDETTLTWLLKEHPEDFKKIN